MSNDSEAREQKPRILVIDDDPELLRGLRLSLTSAAYDVTCVGLPEEALRVATELKPDVVVLDVMMPKIDGWQILAALRQRQATQDTLVLMLTAKTSPEAKVTGFTLGADDYLTKPFSVQELRCRIVALLRRQGRVRQENMNIPRVPVLSGSSAQELLTADTVYYVSGIRNYCYVYTHEERFLSRLRLREIDDLGIEALMRVHRSYIVNLQHVKGVGWKNSSTFTLFLSDRSESAIPVSRSQVREVRERLGLK